MIKAIERTIKLYSAEKDGVVKELAFDFEDVSRICKLKRKVCKIVENSFDVTEYVNIISHKELMHEISRRSVRKSYDYW